MFSHFTSVSVDRLLAHTGIRKRLSSYHLSGTVFMFLFLPLMFYALFVMLPAATAILFSFFRLRGMGIAQVNREFVWLENYSKLIQDKIFWTSLAHNIEWFILTLIFPTIVGLGLAILIQTSNVPGQTFFRAIYFFPQILTPVVVAVIWKTLYEPANGPINTVLRALGLGKFALAWLGDFTWAFPALFVPFLWIHSGFCMVVFLAGMQSIDTALYDAARVDGAAKWQEFWYVTVPGLRNSFNIVYIIGIIASFKIFDFVVVATKGGPGFSTYVLSYYMYLQAFPKDNAGYASAIAVSNALIIAFFAVGFLLLRRKGED